MPQFGGKAQGVPSVAKSLPTVRNFLGGGGPVLEGPMTIRGVTKDSTGAALGNCTVHLFRSADDSKSAEGVSDASGNYRLDASDRLTHYAVAYKAGSPDVAGTTVNTLTGSPG